MLGSPLFSVIVPTRGRSHLLDEAIESILAQTLSDFEVLVVDDAGHDPPAVQHDPRVRVIRRDVNGGAAAARNTGVAAARGKWIAFCDDDDAFAPTRLEVVANSLNSAPVVVCWMAVLSDPHRKPISPRKLYGNVRNDILLGPIPHVGTCTIMRSVMQPFDESFRVSEDVEWWLRLAQTTSIVTVPTVGYLFREHNGDRLTRQIRQRFEARLRLLEVHRSYFAATPAAAAYQWRRAGGLALRLGERRAAKQAFLKAFRLRPSVRNLAHLMRAVAAFM